LQKGQSNFDINFGFSFFICFFAVLRLPIFENFHFRSFQNPPKKIFLQKKTWREMDSASLNKLKVVELQQLLREKGLPTSGNKSELIQASSNSSYILP
jgi:hypothetical protein